MRVACCVLRGPGAGVGALRSLLGHEAAVGYRPLTTDYGLPRVPRIRPEREHEKERAQHILAFGQPGHGFHMQRMQGKERGHEGAAPKRPGHPP